MAAREARQLSLDLPPVQHVVGVEELQKLAPSLAQPGIPRGACPAVRLAHHAEPVAGNPRERSRATTSAALTTRTYGRARRL